MTDKTKINRHPERSVADLENINSILDGGFVCHAAYIVERRPVVVPTLYARDGNSVLLHGSNTMGLARAVRKGSPLSVAVTHIDGLVVARSAFNSSANYRSVVIHGVGEILAGEQKVGALDVIVEALIPGRTADIRANTESELKQTSVIRLPLDEMSAKVRSGDPSDDLEDINTGVWAGVIPMTLQAGEPIRSTDLEEGIATPDYLNPYRR
jgi:uncharacterized protein